MDHRRFPQTCFFAHDATTRKRVCLQTKTCPIKNQKRTTQRDDDLEGTLRESTIAAYFFYPLPRINVRRRSGQQRGRWIRDPCETIKQWVPHTPIQSNAIRARARGLGRGPGPPWRRSRWSFPPGEWWRSRVRCYGSHSGTVPAAACLRRRALDQLVGNTTD